MSSTSADKHSMAVARRFRVLIAIITCFIIILTSFSQFGSIGSIGVINRYGSAAVDAPTVLTTKWGSHIGKAFTEEDDSDLPFVTIGTKGHNIAFNDRTIIDVRSGKPLRFNEGSTFNLAVLKLPRGSKWGFVGVARGPTTRKPFILVDKEEAREQVLVAFGLNITSTGELFAVTPGQTLEIPMQPSLGCRSTGHWIATYGPEDARLFWTDAGTPALQYGKISDHADKCRAIGFTDDLRDLYPPLADALKPSGLVAPHKARPPAAPLSLELTRDKNQSEVEKNWAAFYPGALSNPHAVVPHIHYAFSPSSSLAPIDSSNREVLFTDVYSDAPEEILYCPAIGHPSWDPGNIHQATPLYRFTLCNRGECYPDDQNTVHIGLAHTEKGHWHYGKLVAAFNVTAPYDPISISPRLTMTGMNDDHLHYVLSMIPIEECDLHPFVPCVKPMAPVLPNHFFLDDYLLFSLGQGDQRMMSVLATVKDVVGGHKLCTDFLE